MERFVINPDLSSFSDFWDTVDPPQKTVIENYRAIAGAHNDLWQAIYLRTVTKFWEIDPRGLGSCAITDDVAVQGLPEETKTALIELRNRRSNEAPGESTREGCSHHRMGTGCSLGDLKGPVCLDFVDFYLDDEIEARFGLCLMPVEPYLTHVGNGVDINGQLTKKTVASIRQVKEHIESFPVLTG